MTVRLIDIILGRFKEEFPDNNITSVFRKDCGNGGKEQDIYDVYFNYTFIAEVSDTAVTMYIPSLCGQEVPQKVFYSAIDPKFFYHVVGTARMIFQRYQDLADDGLKRSKYFHNS